jgi:hypothetical protein
MKDAITFYSPSEDYRTNTVARCFNWEGVVAKTTPEGLQSLLNREKFDKGGIIIARTRLKLNDENVWFFKYENLEESLQNAREFFNTRSHYASGSCEDIISEIIIVDMGCHLTSREKYFIISQINKIYQNGVILEYFDPECFLPDGGKIGYALEYIDSILLFIMKGW